MAEQEVKSPVIEHYPLIQSNSVGLPSETLRIPFDGNEALRAALRFSERKVFITPPKVKDGEIGMIGIVQRVVPSLDGAPTLEITVQSRGRLQSVNMTGDVALAKVETVDSAIHPDTNPEELGIFAKTVLAKFRECFKEQIQEAGHDRLWDQLAETAKDQPALIADRIARVMNLDPENKREFLQRTDPEAQLNLVNRILVDIETQRVSMDKIGKKQEEYALREQRDAIDEKLKELTGEDDGNDFDILAQKIAAAGMTEEARLKCEKELKKLRKMNPQDPSASKIEEYLDEMVSLPWTAVSETETDLQKVQEVLDEGHFGLDAVKDRIVEDVAVQLQTGKPSGAILNLIGPPGIGKTSIGQAIADATGRKFVRISLGGVSDEADIRGHRTTYVGAMPGKIIRAMQEAGTMNPVIMLDEIDKMGSGNGMKGDPTAALLEVLDPAQNGTFVDHYTGVKYDLSKVTFICTANEAEKIPEPLYDRTEKIYLKAYNDDDKLEIATRYLIPKKMKKNGLSDDQFSISKEALAQLIEGYTYEAGVRSLEQLIDKLARKAVVQIVKAKKKGEALSVNITPENLEEKKYAGPKRILRQMVNPEPRIGHVNGLAVSGATGKVMELEAVMFPDPKGGVEATGNLMETMADSIKYAYACVKARAAELGIAQETYLNNTLHIKAGKGGVPKDGPSAGLAIGLLDVSVLAKIPIRGDVAMTGEVSILGESGPIGGLAEKLDGAFKAGIRTVLVPTANLKDLEDLDFPKKLKANLEIVTDADKENLGEVPEGKMRVIAVDNLMQVLKHGLVEMPKPLKVDNTLNQQGLGALNGMDPAQLMTLLSQVFAQAAQAKVPANDVMPLPVAAVNRQPVAVNQKASGRRRPRI